MIAHKGDLSATRHWSFPSNIQVALLLSSSLKVIQSKSMPSIGGPMPAQIRRLKLDKSSFYEETELFPYSRFPPFRPVWL
jgi:hypothetical protein